MPSVDSLGAQHLNPQSRYQQLLPKHTCICFALKGYVGIGFTLDFTNGLRIGAGLGVGIEVFLAVDWYELFN